MNPDLLRRIALECERIENEIRQGKPVDLEGVFLDLAPDDRQIALRETHELIEELTGSIATVQDPKETVLIHGRYRLIQAPDEGSIAQEADSRIWLAVDEELDRYVAIKEHIPPLNAPEASLAQFHNEARITAKFEHPGILSVYSQGFLSDSRPYYARRWVQPDTHQTFLDVAEKLQRDRKSISKPVERRAIQSQRDELLRRLIAACDAIAYAHSKNVIHGNIQPIHILLGPYGETLVMSWGKSQLVDSLAPNEDIAGLGRTLQKLIDAWETTELHSRKRRSFWGVALQAVCGKATLVSREEGYNTVGEFALDLDRVLQNEVPTAWSAPWIYRVGCWLDQYRTVASFATLMLMICTPAFVVLGVLQNLHNRQLKLVNENLERSVHSENEYRKQADQQATKADARERLVLEAISSFREEVLKSPDLLQSTELENLRLNLSLRPIDLYSQLLDLDQKIEFSRSELKFLIVESDLAKRIASLKDNPNTELPTLKLPDPKDLGSSDTLGVDLMLDRYGSLLGSIEPDSKVISEFESIVAWYQDTSRNIDPGQSVLLAQQKRYYLSNAIYQLALAQERLGETELSAQLHQRSRAIREELSREQPGITKYQKALDQSLEATNRP
jgi:serine/threonine protein kinase